MDDVCSAGTCRRSSAGCADVVQRTLVTPIGIPILIAMLYVSPAIGWFERGRAKLLLDLSTSRARTGPTRPATDGGGRSSRA
jgi:hypothetical protein